MIHLSRLFTVLVMTAILGLAAFAREGGGAPRQVLVLTTEATLSGTVDQEGTAYRVRNETGETLVPAAKVLRICESLEAAHEYLRGRANLRDPHERIRLARWCQRHDLIEQARDECDAALRLDPRNVEAQRLAKAIENARPAEAARESTPLTEREATSRETVVRSIAEHTYAPETLQSFTRRVQPILFNTCGTGACHGGVKKTGYDLQRPVGNGGVPAPMTRQNLLQTLSLVDKNDPANSLLLKKGLEAHGGSSRSPFAGRDAIPYQALENWVATLAGSDFAEPASEPLPKKSSDSGAETTSGFASGKRASPSTAGSSPLPTVPLRPQPPSPLLDETPEKSMPRRPARPPFKGGEVVSEPPENGADTGAKATPKAPAKPSDPFDPLPFNQKHHPGKER